MPALRRLFEDRERKEGRFARPPARSGSEDGRAREARLDLYQGHLTNEAQESGAGVRFLQG